MAVVQRWSGMAGCAVPRRGFVGRGGRVTEAWTKRPLRERLPGAQGDPSGRVSTARPSTNSSLRFRSDGGAGHGARPGRSGAAHDRARHNDAGAPILPGRGVGRGSRSTGHDSGLRTGRFRREGTRHYRPPKVSVQIHPISRRRRARSGLRPRRCTLTGCRQQRVGSCPGMDRLQRQPAPQADPCARAPRCGCRG